MASKSEGNKPWIVIGRTDAEALISWPPDAKNRLTGKDPDAGQDWRQEKKETTEDEMAGWHDKLNGHEFEQTLGVGDWQGSLACCSPWGCKELDMTEQLNWTELNWTESQGQRSLAGYSPWGHKESDMTERLNNENNTPPPHPLHTHSRMKFFHLQHHGWTRRALCLVK